MKEGDKPTGGKAQVGGGGGGGGDRSVFLIKRGNRKREPASGEMRA